MFTKMQEVSDDEISEPRLIYENNEFEVKFCTLLAAKCFVKIRNSPVRLEHVKANPDEMFNFEFLDSDIEQRPLTHTLIKPSNNIHSINKETILEDFKDYICNKRKFLEKKTSNPIFKTDFSDIKFVLNTQKRIEPDTEICFENCNFENNISNMLKFNDRDSVFKIQLESENPNSIVRKLSEFDSTSVEEFCNHFFIHKFEVSESELDGIIKSELSLLYEPEKSYFLCNYFDRKFRKINETTHLTVPFFTNKNINFFFDAEILYELQRLQKNTPVNIKYYEGGPKYFDIISLHGSKKNILIWTYKKAKFSIVEYFEDKTAICHVKDANAAEFLLRVLKMKNTDGVKWLVQHGVNVNLKYQNRNILIAALKYLNFDTIKLLIENGARVTDLNGYVIDSYVSRITLKILELLFQNGLDPNVELGNTYTLLYYALETKNVKLFELLAQYKAEFTEENTGQISQYQLICNLKDLKYVNIFIQNYDINNKDSRGNTLLHIATLNNRYDLVELLLISGADVNVTNQLNKTALHVAVSNENLMISKLLLNYGMDKNSVSTNNETALSIVVNSEMIPTVKNSFMVLLARQDDCPLIKKNKRPRNSLLHSAVIERNVDDIPQLICMGADVNCTDIVKNTPLHIAASLGHLETVQKLTEFDAKVNVYDANGSSPLHLAAGAGHLKIVKFLCDLGANVGFVNKYGKTARIMAEENERFDVELFLKSEENENNLEMMQLEDESETESYIDFEVID